jgi:hypothetical protein
MVFSGLVVAFEAGGAWTVAVRAGAGGGAIGFLRTS